MKRRDFLLKGSLLSAVPLVYPFTQAACAPLVQEQLQKKAKNVIFMVSDGMSMGTLTMAHVLKERKEGIGSNWIKLYQDQKVKRALMETSSLNSIVTDSAAGSSAWGGGKKVNNNALNWGVNGEIHEPILQKFKKKGKAVGCVTTVPVTHATPAGFCISAETRKNQEYIAELYLKFDFDVLLGGGLQYFDASSRSDKRAILSEFAAQQVEVIKDKKELFLNSNRSRFLGLFADDALPYAVDRANNQLYSSCPSLQEMSAFAIKQLNKNPKGFALQIEAGKVDWAAHGNDIGGLIYDQLEFDETIKTVLEFAEKVGETLVIITTDHGNSNPGVLYGEKTNQQFDLLQKYSASNAEILTQISANTSVTQVQELIYHHQHWQLEENKAKEVLSQYQNLTEDDIKNYRKLPFFVLSKEQEKAHHIGWIGDEHSADMVELCAFGPGSELLGDFHKNTDLHNLMLFATDNNN